MDGQREAVMDLDAIQAGVVAPGTLPYEIVTRFTGKVRRTYSGVTAAEAAADGAKGTAPALGVDGRANGQVAAAL